MRRFIGLTRNVAVYLAAALLGGCLTTQSDWASLQQAVEETKTRLGTSAISVAIFDANDVLEQVTFGTVSVESSIPVGPEPVWHLGSCTKAMTATIIGRLVDRGDVRFGTTIGEVFADAHPGFGPVTMAQLLRHHGGTTGSIYQTHPEQWNAMWRGYAGNHREVRRAAVAEILDSKPQQPVGTYTYSNAGYLVAAAMAEDLTDTSWQELMRSELFEPLGMGTAGFGAPKDDAPWPHSWKNSAHVPVSPMDPVSDNPPSLGPAGTVHASMNDWIRFLQVYIGGGPEEFLRSDTMDALLSPVSRTVRVSGTVNTDAAAGWFAVNREWAGGRALNHAGSNTMNYAVTWLAPEKGLGIAIATNGAGPESAAITDKLAGWLVTRYISTVD